MAYWNTGYPLLSDPATFMAPDGVSTVFLRLIAAVMPAPPRPASRAADAVIINRRVSGSTH